MEKRHSLAGTTFSKDHFASSARCFLAINTTYRYAGPKYCTWISDVNFAVPCMVPTGDGWVNLVCPHAAMNALLVSNAMLNDPKSRDRYTMICTGSKTKRKRSYVCPKA
jgi:hypothetical protein